METLPGNPILIVWENHSRWPRTIKIERPRYLGIILEKVHALKYTVGYRTFFFMTWYGLYKAPSVRKLVTRSASFKKTKSLPKSLSAICSNLQKKSENLLYYCKSTYCLATGIAKKLFSKFYHRLHIRTKQDVT